MKTELGLRYFADEDLQEITYVGICRESVEVHLNDGRAFRITNPNYMLGLEIKEIKKGR